MLFKKQSPREETGTHYISLYNVTVVVFWFFVVSRFLEEHGFKLVTSGHRGCNMGFSGVYRYQMKVCFLHA